MNTMKKLLFFAAASVMTVSTAFAGGDLSKTQARIYINPGHGSWGPNDRNLATINHAIGDTCGFYESNTNLWKALKMGSTLEKWGVPKANIKYSRVKNGPYPYVSGAANEELYNRDLTEIAEECNAFNTDYFLSIHSDAASDGAATNRALLIYNGYSVPAADNENMWEGTRSLEYQQTSRAMAETLWPILVSNGVEVYTSKDMSTYIVGDLTFYYGYKTPADNAKNAAGYLGVLRRNTCNGFLSEGYCHTYQPARHRALNRDFCGQEGVRYARAVAEWFGWETESTGYIMGAVKDLHEVFSHTVFHPNTSSLDIYKPINGAVVTLYKAGVKVADYTCDNEYNGIFVFENLEPGDDYTLEVKAEGYKSNVALDEEYGREAPKYSVKANETTYMTIQLEVEGYVENPTFNYPEPIQEEWLNVMNKYEMRKDFVKKSIDVLSGKTIRREVVKGDSTYVLALDDANKPYIYCFDARTQDMLFEVSTEGVGTSGDANEVLPISDIAFTSDSILVACNQVKTSFTPSGVFRTYKWERHKTTRAPEGKPLEWFTSATNYTSGNFTSAVTGTTFAVNGRSDDCVVATTAQTTGSSKEVRIPLFTITRKGLLGTIRNQDKSHFTEALLGADYKLVASPYGDKAFVIDGSNTTPFEFSMNGDVAAPVYGSKLSSDIMPAAVNGATFFRYAKHTLMVVPTVADGAYSGVQLYDVTNGLDKAALIETTETTVSGAASSTYANAYSGVNGVDIALYLSNNGEVSRFTTDGVEQNYVNNIFAFDLASEQTADGYNFTFTSNENSSRGGRIVFYDVASGEEVGEIAISSITRGENSVAVAADDVPGVVDQNLKWAVEVEADNVAIIRNLLSKDDYKLNRAYVAVDASPISPKFGSLYVSDYAGASKASNGVYVYDALYNRLNDTPINTPAFNTNGALGISSNGNVFVTDAVAARAGLWTMPCGDTQSGFTQFFEGENTSGIITSGDAEVAGITSSVAFRGTGADEKMYAFVKTSSGKYAINIYNIGGADGLAATTWGVAPSKVLTLPFTAESDATIVPVEQGVWLCQTISSQSNTENKPTLLFIDYDGKITFNQGMLANKPLLSGAGGSAMCVSRDESTLVVNDENGLFQFYDVTFNGTTPTLTPRYSYEHGIGVASRRLLDGKYIEQMAFDYAGNLVASGHYLGVFTIPTDDNRCLVPAADIIVKTSDIRGVEADDADENAPVEYFNLQGVKVEKPENGIFIKRQGKKVEKVIIQ